MYQNNQFMPYSQQNGITWVQGIEGAKAFQLMPNSNAVLMDSENDGVFYIKVCDNVGMCNLRIFNFTEVANKPKQETNMDNYITKQEFYSALEELKHEQSVSKSKSKSATTITE